MSCCSRCSHQRCNVVKGLGYAKTCLPSPFPLRWKKTLSGPHKPSKILREEYPSFASQKLHLMCSPERRNHHVHESTYVGCHPSWMERIPGSARCCCATTYPRTTGVAGRAQLTLSW